MACADLDHTHAAWTKLLQEYAAPQSHGERLDYARWKREGQAELDGYLHALAAVCPATYASWAPPQQIAFWLNAYNAYTVRLVLDHYPITSIRKIGILPFAAFRARFVPIHVLGGDRDLTLEEIENDVLRKRFHEPRIHFALVCAAVSCPKIGTEAYRAADLDAQLTARGRAFLADGTKNHYVASLKTLYLSPIFDWYRADFEAAAGSLVAFVAPYLAEPDATAVREAGVKIVFLPYEWALNGL
ncbi:MAG TPA: DUF547 domain-containing protein [Candidatus Binatia bacterium]|nr:DUF547 domain-containing protein [Candidatus Binatia bacterium]